ncbi:MAG TPA: hypothetical protein VIV11_30630 [Kofleriaceae bacterium]
MRKALLIGGLVVALLVIALVYAINKDSPPAEATATGSGSAATPAPRPSAPTVTPGLPGTAPQLPVPAPGEHPKDYVVGDIRVRDHREGDHKPLDIPPNVHPAEGPSIPSTLTHEIAQKVKAVVYDCVKALPSDARGDKPRIEGQILIAIKDHNVTITKSTMQLRNVTGESVEPTKQCIESKSVGITNPAPDQQNIDSYSINVTYAIP